MKDLIIRGGENIVSYLLELMRPISDSLYLKDVLTVENALYADERVNLCAVVGVPDARFGELPVAVVHLKPNAHATERDLIERVRPQSVKRSIVDYYTILANTC